MTEETSPFGPKYPKIYGPFNRHTQGPKRNQLIEGDWTFPHFETLADVPWIFTEKIDGTNIRVHWDGHSPVFGGRTDKTQHHPELIAALERLFPEELLEQTFKDQTVTLYGEGYGKGIQKLGELYGKDKGFALFDIRVGKFWLTPEVVREVGQTLQLDVVPARKRTLNEAIEEVRSGLTSLYGDFTAEGLVGTPVGGLLDRHGARIQVKVKTVDFCDKAA